MTFKPCNKYWGLGHDIECHEGILIDADEYAEGWQRDVIYQPCSCNPKFCMRCRGIGMIVDDEGAGDCPHCNCGWVGEIEYLSEPTADTQAND